MSEEKIVKPCPFCGGEAWVIQILEDLYAVECRKCWTRTGTYQPTEAEAIEAWNRRAERTAKVEFERLEEDVKIGAGTFRKGTTVLSKCSACDGWVKPGDTYCYHCGAKLDWSDDE